LAGAGEDLHEEKLLKKRAACFFRCKECMLQTLSENPLLTDILGNTGHCAIMERECSYS